METEELKAEVYDALTKDEALLKGLHGGKKGIYALQAPAGDAARVPYLVYSVLSDVPGLMGDNGEILRRVTMRIHTVGKAGDVPSLAQAAGRVMLSLGFIRVQTTEFIEDGRRVIASDYRTGV